MGHNTTPENMFGLQSSDVANYQAIQMGTTGLEESAHYPTADQYGQSMLHKAIQYGHDILGCASENVGRVVDHMEKKATEIGMQIECRVNRAILEYEKNHNKDEMNGHGAYNKFYAKEENK